MATFFTDFSEDTPGEAPAGLTTAVDLVNGGYVTTFEVQERADAIGGQVLRLEGFRFLVRASDLGKQQQGEMAVRLRVQRRPAATHVLAQSVPLSDTSWETAWCGEIHYNSTGDNENWHVRTGGGSLVKTEPFAHSGGHYLHMRGEGNFDSREVPPGFDSGDWTWRFTAWADGVAEEDGLEHVSETTRAPPAELVPQLQYSGRDDPADPLLIDVDWIALATDGDVAPVPVGKRRPRGHHLGGRGVCR